MTQSNGMTYNGMEKLNFMSLFDKDLFCFETFLSIFGLKQVTLGCLDIGFR